MTDRVESDLLRRSFPYVIEDGRLSFNPLSTYVLELTHSLVLQPKAINHLVVLGKLTVEQRRRFDSETEIEGHRAKLIGERPCLLDDIDVSWVKARSMFVLPPMDVIMTRNIDTEALKVDPSAPSTVAASKAPSPSEEVNKIPNVIPFPYVFNGSCLVLRKTSFYVLELSHNLIITNERVEMAKVLGKINTEDRKRFDYQTKSAEGSGWMFSDNFAQEMDICSLTPEDRAWASQNNLNIDDTVCVTTAPTLDSTTPIVSLGPIFSVPTTTTHFTPSPPSSTTTAPTTPVPTLTAAQAEVQRVFETTFKYHTELFPWMTAPDLFTHIQASLTQYIKLREPME